VPYRIIKIVKHAATFPLLRSGGYAANFGVDLDDEKTWKLYPTYALSSITISGEVLQLLDRNGNGLYTVKENFDFSV
jgi:hypothetical protein